MRKSRRSPEQIMEILQQVEASKAEGKLVAQLCKEAGVGEWTYCRWRKHCQSMSKRDAKRLKELERENARLKKLPAEKELDNIFLKEALGGNY